MQSAIGENVESTHRDIRRVAPGLHSSGLDTRDYQSSLRTRKPRYQASKRFAEGLDYPLITADRLEVLKLCGHHFDTVVKPRAHTPNVEWRLDADRVL